MRILSRYILREFLVPLGYCMALFLGIYILFELIGSFGDILKAKPPFLTVVAYFIGYLSPFFIWLFPAALMLAALYTMWNFCRHSEITAMRANGIGFVVIVRPLLLVAACAMLLVAGLNEFYTPEASEWAWKLREDDFKQAPKRTQENIAYYNHIDRRIWHINRLDLRTPHILEGVRLSLDREDKSRMLEITARRAEYLDGAWWFFNPQYQYFDELADPVDNPYKALESLTMRCFPELSEHPRDFLVMNKKAEHTTTRDLIRDLKKNPLLNARDRVIKRYEIGSRLIAPFSCRGRHRAPKRLYGRCLGHRHVLRFLWHGHSLRSRSQEHVYPRHRGRPLSQSPLPRPRPLSLLPPAVAQLLDVLDLLARGFQSCFKGNHEPRHLRIVGF
jgi:lipopolysaccharide export LptBFGC system permease protein LptF